MKKARQETILSIIANNEVETQEELAELLKEAGFSVTQATVSRDIRELSLTKIIGEGGKQKYMPFFAGETVLPGGAGYAIRTAAFSVDYGGNLLVIKTRTGMGMAVAVEIDAMKLPEILGTIGSDDVVFCAVKTTEQAVKLKALFKSIIADGGAKGGR